jgi:3-deoxy-D-manno-octulosonic acid (KDO) 8-phosphate synthase
MRTFNIHNIKLGNNEPLVLIAGPCQIESLDHTLETAHSIKPVIVWALSLSIKAVLTKPIDLVYQLNEALESTKV